MTGGRQPRVLLLQLEYPTWQVARPWSYAAGLGTEEGLSAAGVEFFTLTTPWLPRAPEILQGRHFDQVWMEAVHQAGLSDPFWAWMREVAPVRVAFLPESLAYASGERELMPEAWPRLQARKARVSARLRHFTHVVAVDERDAETIPLEHRRPAVWWPQAVPERFVCREVSAVPDRPALFGGTAYGARGAFLEHPALRSLLAVTASPEDRTMYPGLFEALHLAALQFLQGNMPDAGTNYAEYITWLRRVRSQCFAYWLEGLRAGCAVVNLPHVVKAYAGRVVEGMAAGRPVISWEIPDRPLNRSLFEPGQEILFFDRSQPDELAAHIRRIQREPAWARQLAHNARRKLLRFHTVEHRVRQILDWVAEGTAPAWA